MHELNLQVVSVRAFTLVCVFVKLLPQPGGAVRGAAATVPAADRGAGEPPDDAEQRLPHHTSG